MFTQVRRGTIKQHQFTTTTSTTHPSDGKVGAPKAALVGKAEEAKAAAALVGGGASDAATAGGARGGSPADVAAGFWSGGACCES